MLHIIKDRRQQPRQQRLAASIQSHCPVRRLQSLSLICTSLREIDLIAALVAHESTLEKLHLEQLELSSGSWPSLFKVLRERMTKLEAIGLKVLYDGATGSDFGILPHYLGLWPNYRHRREFDSDDGEEAGSFDIGVLSAHMEGAVGIVHDLRAILLLHGIGI